MFSLMSQVYGVAHERGYWMCIIVWDRVQESSVVL